MISSVDAYKITLNEVSDADFIVQPQRVPITDQRVRSLYVLGFLNLFRFAFTAWKRRQNMKFPSRRFRTIFNQRPCRFELKRLKKIATGWKNGTNGGPFSSLISQLNSIIQIFLVQPVEQNVRLVRSSSKKEELLDATAESCLSSAPRQYPLQVESGHVEGSQWMHF